LVNQWEIANTSENFLRWTEIPGAAVSFEKSFTIDEIARKYGHTILHLLRFITSSIPLKVQCVESIKKIFNCPKFGHGILQFLRKGIDQITPKNLKNY
jgi:hypothetical protein